jgi:hypothetical protein
LCLLQGKSKFLILGDLIFLKKAPFALNFSKWLTKHNIEGKSGRPTGLSIQPHGSGGKNSWRNEK